MRRFALVAAALVLAAVALVRPAVAVEIKRVVSPGGIEAWLVEDPKIPVVALSWSFEGAGAVAPPNKQGLANLAAATMDEGAGDLDSQAFQARLADIAAKLTFNAGREGFSGRLVSLRDELAPALELARLALTRPRFDEEALTRMRAAIASDVRRDAGDPNHLAQRALFAAAFPGHPYGVDQRGDEASLNRISSVDLRAFVARELGRDRLLVAAAGAIGAEELGAALDQLFGALPAASTVTPVADAAPQRLGETVTVDLPSVQTIVMAAGPGVARRDPDWYAARLAAQIVGGGGFSSRLMDEVRVKRGLTYGIYAGLISFDRAPLVYFSGSTQNARAGDMLAAAREVWGAMGRDGPTADELAAAKTWLTGSLPLQLDSTPTVADFVLQIRRDKLPIDILSTRDAEINAVTLEQVRAASARLFNPDKLLTVLVGRPEGLAR